MPESIFRIAHICPDEKFTDFISEVFNEALPEHNDFYVYLTKNYKSLNFTKKTKIHTTITSNPPAHKLISIANKLSEYDLIVAHYLHPITDFILRHLTKSIPIMWSGWGADYYQIISPDLSLYLLPRTRQYLQWTNAFKWIPRKIIYVLKRISVFMDNDKFIYKRVSGFPEYVRYFSAPVHDDYLYIQNIKSDFKPVYIQVNNASLKSLYSEKNPIPGELSQNSGNILLGNSASTTNNHLDAIDLLKQINTGERKIIAPLTYGNGQYTNKIIKYGKKNLQGVFYPLTTYIPQEEYNKIIQTCSIMIMNHLRQEGLGNIIIMLEMGSKIFLQKANPIYIFLKKAGTHVFEISSLLENQKAIFAPLSASQIKKNKEIARKYWEHSVVINNIKSFINTVHADNRNGKINT